MKAAIYNGPKDVQLTELPTPEVGDDDVLIRNLHAGICGSDVSAYEHGPQAHQITLGTEFGHEVVSRVVAKGRNVTGLEVGQRVYPYPLLAKGDPARAGTLGGFSEYILVPNAEAGVQLYPVPDAISDSAGSLIEPFTIAMHAARQAGPAAGERAIVFGAGTIGVATAICLKHLGCGQIMVADLSDFRLGKAADLGFLTCNPAREDVKARAVEAFGEVETFTGPTADVDLFVDAAGADSLIGTYQDIGKTYSRLVVVGVHARPVEVDFARLTYLGQRITGTGGYTPEDVIAVMDLMVSGKFAVESLVTHEFPLEEIVTAIETASDVNSALHVSIVH